MTNHFEVIHWPVAFAPGDDLMPEDDNGEVKLDFDTPLAHTWKAMSQLQQIGKACIIVWQECNKLTHRRLSGQEHWRFKLHS